MGASRYAGARYDGVEFLFLHRRRYIFHGVYFAARHHAEYDGIHLGMFVDFAIEIPGIGSFDLAGHDQLVFNYLEFQGCRDRRGLGQCKDKQG